MPGHVALGVGLVEPGDRADRDLRDADRDQWRRTRSPTSDREDPLATDRLHEGVRGVDADEHQHEQEQHQDRAGVDDDLHREQERRVLHERTARPGRPSRPRAAARSGRPCARPGVPSAQATITGARIQNAIIRAHLPSRRVVRERAAVVVALVVAEPHRVRRLLHAGQQRREEVGLLVDQVGTVVVGQLVLVGHRERPRRAGLDAQPAQDAAQVVDLVDAAVALARGEPLVLGVGGTLDVDRVGGAGPGAELAADALLQPVGPAVELVPAVEARAPSAPSRTGTAP